MELDLIRSSRYPFLEGSREFVRKMNLTLEDMLSSERSQVKERALERIEEAIDGKELNTNMKRTPGEVETDLLSYPVARFLVAAVSDSHLIKWFSHHEGERAKAYLQKEDIDTVKEIGREMEVPVLDPPPGSAGSMGRKKFMDSRRALFMERSQKDGQMVWIDFKSFLTSRRNITGPSWDLINQRLVDGKIGIDRESYIRLIQEKIKEKVEEGLDSRPPVPKDPDLKMMVKNLKTRIETRRKKYAPTELGKMTITRLPPCMRQILGMSQAGENLPHHARFALTTFLNAIGMSPKEIFNVFTTAPDFKGDIVRYQVEHITGSTSATSYHTPNCETMKSGGICFNPDGLCEKEWMNSPLYYYKLKGRKKGKKDVTSQ